VDHSFKLKDTEPEATKLAEIYPIPVRHVIDVIIIILRFGMVVNHNKGHSTMVFLYPTENLNWCGHSFICITYSYL
jgi:hypothetical protein